MIPGRLCIQEEFKKHCKTTYHYGAGDTVGVHMVALAVMLGLNPIYVTGIDLDYSDGYVRNNFETSEYRINMGMQSMNNSPVMVARVLDDLTTIRNAAENIGTKIYDLDGTGKIADVFDWGRPAVKLK